MGLSRRTGASLATLPTVALNPEVCVSDLHAFHAAVEAARHAGRGPAGLASAEDAVAAYGGRLLCEVGGLGRRRGQQPRGPLFGWVDELPTQRAASALEALYREALILLATRLREAGRPEEALQRYWAVLDVGDMLPSDRVCETTALGVLEAAEALGDPTCLRAEFELLSQHFSHGGVELTPFVLERYAALAGRLGAAELLAAG